MPSVDVHPEIAYTDRRDVIYSVDWIVVFDDLVLLVEAKATRTPAAARAADVTAQERWHRPCRQHGRSHPRRPHRALRRDLPDHRHVRVPQGLTSSAGGRQRPANGALHQLAPRHQRMADPALPFPDLRLVHLRAAFSREQLKAGRLAQEGCAVRRPPCGAPQGGTEEPESWCSLTERRPVASPSAADTPQRGVSCTR
jgi:hypothetical protein